MRRLVSSAHSKTPRITRRDRTPPARRLSRLASSLCVLLGRHPPPHLMLHGRSWAIDRPCSTLSGSLRKKNASRSDGTGHDIKAGFSPRRNTISSCRARGGTRGGAARDGRSATGGARTSKSLMTTLSSRLAFVVTRSFLLAWRGLVSARARTPYRSRIFKLTCSSVRGRWGLAPLSAIPRATRALSV
jgi:hypothetical protein